MRILILSTDYPEFVAELYAKNRGLETRPYDEQMAARFASLFGVADFYSYNLAASGHEAATLIVNNAFAQRAWAREAGMPVPDDPPAAPDSMLRRSARAVLRRAPRPVTRFAGRMSARLLPLRAKFDTAIVAEQIRRFRPDVLINQAVDGIPSQFIREMRPYVRLMAGQLAAPIPNVRLDVYDVMLSSLPNFVARFRSQGLRSELHPFAFDERVLNRLPEDEPSIPVSFVGTFSAAHARRSALLEYLARSLDLQLWGHAVEKIPASSTLHERYRGPAYGIDMYRVLHASRAAVNFHIAVSGPFANNMRLFEATGVGTLLVTDWKQNLHELFEPETEVVTFRSPEECREKLVFYLAHEAERQRVAAAGQRRTLRDHTYRVRMPQLVEMLRRYL
ncbi:MAG TPA: glycosyltransferase [Thermoanaerobaculia bacterium]|nr:glycosyltransferase [Thermoanaerobaculia bacterium]